MRNMKNEVNVPKSNNKNSLGIYRGLVVLMVALFALPVMAGWVTQNNSYQVVTTAYAFQSTSAMQEVGSPYSSTPAGLNADGQATYSDPESSLSAPAYAPRGPHKSIEYNEEFDDNDEASPIGDAVLPLLLMAAAAAGVIAYRRRRAAQALNG